MQLLFPQLTEVPSLRAGRQPTIQTNYSRTVSVGSRNSRRSRRSARDNNRVCPTDIVSYNCRIYPQDIRSSRAPLGNIIRNSPTTLVPRGATGPPCIADSHCFFLVLSSLVPRGARDLHASRILIGLLLVLSSLVPRGARDLHASRENYDVGLSCKEIY
jgi:hypothetical protein